MNDSGGRARFAARTFVAGLLLMFASPGFGEDASSLYREGIRAFRASGPVRAIDLLQRSTQADPTFAFPILALARIYHQRFEQEAVDYGEAAQYYERLSVLLKQKPPKEAEKQIYQGLYFRGLLHLKGGEYEKAISSLRIFKEIYPEFASMENVHNAIGISLYYEGQYDLAVEEFRNAISINPESYEARFNLRSVYTRLSVYRQAVANTRAGNLETAERQISQLKEFAPRYLPGRRLEAELYQKTGRPAQALSTMEEILAIAPRHALSYGTRIDLARLLESRGETPRAIQLLQENLRLFPDSQDKEARRNLLLLLERLEGNR